MDDLILELKRKRVLESGSLETTLRRVDRADFVLSEDRDRAYEDIALPTLAGQTISQPYTVVFMLEKLAVESGQTVLDIGAGSGWQTAILAALVGESGRVHAYEVVPTLYEFGRENLAKYPDLLGRVEWHLASGRSRLGKKFDRLIVAAALATAPPPWWRGDLRDRGRLVYPRGYSIMVEEKSSGQFHTAEFPGFVFVPFV